MSLSIQSKTHVNFWVDVQVELSNRLGNLSDLVLSFVFNREEYFGQSRQSPFIDALERSAFERESSKIPCEVIDNWSHTDELYCYPNEGQEDYFLFSFQKEIIIASQLFQNHLQRSNSNPYLFLDVGAGDGRFSLTCDKIAKRCKRLVETHNLSASDLRRDEFPLSHYHIHDAMDILNCAPIASQKWDFIIGRLSFPYFPDRARTICQYYELLKSDGLLIITDLQFLGLEDQMEALVNFLNAAGYAVLASINKIEEESGQIKTLIIQKTHDHLNFPFGYDLNLEEAAVCYKPDPDLMTKFPKKEGSTSHSLHMFSKSDYTHDTTRKFITPPSDHPLTKLIQSIKKV